MSIQLLLSIELPQLSYQDSGERALRLMSEYQVSHLPLVHKDDYIALISEEDIMDWDTPEQPLSYAEFLTFRPAIQAQSHPYEALKTVSDFNLSVLPVVDSQNHFMGTITKEGLFAYLIDNNATHEQGAILVLEIEQKNYSLSEIARICESNNVTILSSFIKTIKETGMLQVTIKTNQNETQALAATFERYEYHVAEIYASDDQDKNIKSNYDMLMHYISI
ncbi:MAG: CBS domain-containing protein [Chitinophagaceae bacterium]